MSFDQTFLKLFEDSQADSSPSGEEKSTPAKGADETVSSAGFEARPDIFSLDEERQMRIPKNDESFGDEFFFFDEWDRSIAPNGPEQIDDAHSFRPSERFRRLWAERRRPRTENSVPPLSFSSEKLDHCDHENPSISLFAFPDHEIDESVDLRLFGSENESRTPERIVKSSAEPRGHAENRATERTAERRSNELIFDMSGQELEPPMVSEFAAPSVCDCRVFGWPKQIARLVERGQTEFARLADLTERQLAGGGRVFGFGGAGFSVGTSSLLLGLTKEMTERGFSLLVLDADFRRPALAEMLSLSPERGWENFIDDSVPDSGLLRVLVDHGTPRRRFFPRSSEPEPKSAPEEFFLLPLLAERVATAAATACKKIWLERLLNLSERFDATLVDCGSLLTESHREKVSEMLRFGLDGFYLVGDVRSVDGEPASAFLEECRRRQLTCLGRIENFT